VRPLLFAALAILVGSAGIFAVDACGTFSGSSTNGSANDATATDATTSDATSSDAQQSALDGGPIVDATLQDTGDLFDDNFESDSLGDTCNGWTCDSCTTNVVKGIARTGTNSCQICLSASVGSDLRRDLPGPGPGIYTFEVYVATMNDGGIQNGDGGGFAAGYLSFFDPMSNGTGKTIVSDAPIPTPQTWTHLQVPSGTSPDASTTRAQSTLYIEPETSGDCWYIDDVRFYKH
jgi:hypothetical protein